MEEAVKIIEKAFFQGNYSACEQMCNDLNEQCRNSKLNVSDYGLDEQEFSCVIENNILALRSLTWIRDNGSYESWNDLMQNFIQLNHEYTILQALHPIPLKYYLNAVHNTLWWGWWHPHGFPTDRSLIDTCIHLGSDCFRRVLEHCGNEYISSCFSDNENAVVQLMKSISDNLSKLRMTETLQLVDILILTMLMLLELEPGWEICVECIGITSTVLSERSKVPDDEKEWRCNLKLGLTPINSIVEKTDAQVSFTLLKICLCMFHMKVQQYAECVDSIGTSQPVDVELCFVESYLKAYACYMASDLETSLLFLSAMEKMAVSCCMKVKYHLQAALVLSKAERHNDSLVELFKALHQHCRELAAVILLCIAREYEILYKGCPMGSLGSSLQAAHVDTLYHLVQVLKDKRNACSSFCIKSRILNIVHKEPPVTLSEALYLLGTALARSGNVGAACDVYAELLGLSDMLPHASVTLHDATALLLKHGKLEEAETVCRRAVSCYVLHNSGLLSLEDDVVALMLLAHIYKLKAQYILEADTLDRCLRIINNFKRQKQLPDGSEMLDLLSVLSAKLHAEKANNYLKRSPSFRRDAVYELRQAVLCNPGDEDILKSYKLLVDGVPYNKTDDQGTAHTHKMKLPSEDCSEIALTYLIESYSQRQ